MADSGGGPLSRPQEELWMSRCIDLARNGSGYVSPNPMVGAVLIRDGNIIAEGWHQKFGGPHAEVNAVRALRDAGGDPRGCTLVVNLEPCNYTGKTPPCTDLILESGIARVIVGMLDPNPKVSGNGIAELKAAGVQVTTGVLAPECLAFNRAFVKFIRTGTPLVVLKSAQTLDGRITNTPGSPSAITGPEALSHSHQMRHELDAILVGAGTIQADNPELNVRLVSGRNPVRVVLSTTLNLDLNAKVFERSVTERVIVFTTDAGSAGSDKVNEANLKLLREKNVTVHRLPTDMDGHFDLKEIVGVLGRENIASVLVEGGAKTTTAFLAQRLADRLALYIAPKIFGSGTLGFPQHPRHQSFHLSGVHSTRLGGDILIEGDIVYPHAVP